MSVNVYPATIASLRSTLSGTVIEPQDDGYDKARWVYGGFDRRPAAVVRVADVDDVVKVVNFARETGTELSVRSGGHSNAGHNVIEGGLVLDLRDLSAVDLDLENGTAWAQGGATAGAYTEAAVEHNVATGFGDTGSVGIGGITTGGGIGYLVRKHGLTIDNLLAAEVVTADGEIRYVDEENHPDLFWAIRGGGGNFGVVTRLKFRLFPLDGIVGGMITLPATPETVTGFIAAADAAPEELSTIVNVMNAPPMPFLPEEVHGKLIVLALVVWSGAPEAADEVLAPFRALATPLADFIQPMPYSGMFPHEEEAEQPSAAATTMFIDRVDTPAAETILHFLESSDSSMRAVQLRVLGGAMSRVAADATAFAHRDSKILVNLATFYESAEEKVVRDAWISDFRQALRQSDGGAYVNFLSDEGPDRVRDAYPGETWNRLRQIKAKYDPANLFRVNQNIPPATD
ncbi:FAD-linked oxidase [Sphaerisporangium melleum]|uniref:FAD-linked oxidase n=1 Tax=Sphaerisporangium melleum TaxID=321316 RepID=A0A917RAI3_9ACTN|nr:FAD-binding oxidoreductase [Sphaerisporangium melleum]GGK97362.1 FAD-linked oxidase [Sphaerisporangium melleum]GII71113.1 FAD-linked oxidase [Sphaerisporangium melleum]